VKSLILASTSPYRRALLARLGIPFDVASSDVDETIEATEVPHAAAQRLAIAKAVAIARRYKSSWVLGYDQTLDFAGVVLRKPTSEEAARTQLATLAGHTHTLHNGIALVCVNATNNVATVHSALVSVSLTMRKLSAKEIDAYVARDKPGASVGGYLYEQTGFALFEKVVGSDDSAIVGLPLVETANLLRLTEVL
jgi:septum formation protein